MDGGVDIATNFATVIDDIFPLRRQENGESQLTEEEARDSGLLEIDDFVEGQLLSSMSDFSSDFDGVLASLMPFEMISFGTRRAVAKSESEMCTWNTRSRE